MKSYRHPIGLTLRAPETLSAEQTPNGYVFTPANAAKMRSPTQIVSELRSGAAPAGDWPERRRIKDHIVHYRIDVEPGAGSGGDYYTLRAWEQIGKDHVWVEQDVQIEVPGEPDFSSAWWIIESVEVAAN